MSRYIDADALWDKMQKFYTDGDCGDDDGYNLGINVGITKCHNLLTKVPSIEIIRCGECKHWRNDGFCTRPLYSIEYQYMRADDFCSYGERSEKPNNCEPQTERSSE